MKFHFECNKNHVCGHLAAQDMATFVKHVFLQRSFGVIFIFEKSIESYIERCSQNIKRKNGSSCYEHILISRYYDIVKFEYYNVRMLQCCNILYG